MCVFVKIRLPTPGLWNFNHCWQRLPRAPRYFTISRVPQQSKPITVWDSLWKLSQTSPFWHPTLWL